MRWDKHVAQIEFKRDIFLEHWVRDYQKNSRLEFGM
jgi:hypothetical protein